MTTVVRSLFSSKAVTLALILAIGTRIGTCQMMAAAIGEEMPATATIVEGLALPDVEIRKDKNRLYFAAQEGKSLPTKLTLPRLANVVKSVHWIAENNATMQVKSEPKEWTIDVSPRPENSAPVIVAELDAPIELFHKTVIARPDKDSGIILLPAKYAATHGSKLRFEPQPHKNTVGYWSDEHDSAEWTFQIAAAGEYEIDILQGCGKGHGGSVVTLQVADQSQEFTVQETGHFQNFIWRTLGNLTLKPDAAESTSSLKLMPKSKPGGAVMDVRAIRLCPKGIERTFESELADPQSLPAKQ